jgi:hypothetical protein
VTGLEQKLTESNMIIIDSSKWEVESHRLGGILAPQYFGTVVFWHRSILALWNFGTTVKRHLLKT